MYHTQVNEYKYEIERLNRDYQILKKKYFERKRRDREARQHNDQFTHNNKSAIPSKGLQQHLNQYSHYANSTVSRPSTAAQGGANMTTAMLRPNFSAGPRFSGGGFNMGNSIIERGSVVAAHINNHVGGNGSAYATPIPVENIPRGGSVLAAVMVAGDEAEQALAAIQAAVGEPGDGNLNGLAATSGEEKLPPLNPDGDNRVMYMTA
jgi:hypothetical protein